MDEYFDRRFVRTLIEEHMQFIANHNHVLWAVLNLAVWHQLFIESDHAPVHVPVGQVMCT